MDYIKELQNLNNEQIYSVFIAINQYFNTFSQIISYFILKSNSFNCVLIQTIS